MYQSLLDGHSLRQISLNMALAPAADRLPEIDIQEANKWASRNRDYYLHASELLALNCLGLLEILWAIGSPGFVWNASILRKERYGDDGRVTVNLAKELKYGRHTFETVARSGTSVELRNCG